MHFRIRPARTAEDLKIVAQLFAAYAASLPVELEYQDFAVELTTLPGKYAPPRGALLLGLDGLERPLGCVGLRPLEGGGCEMKRLYLLPRARGLGLGRALAEAVIGEARRLGYSELRLDTLATMRTAARLYERMGFTPIDPYYGPTPPGTKFMAIAL